MTTFACRRNSTLTPITLVICTPYSPPTEGWLETAQRITYLFESPTRGFETGWVIGLRCRRPRLPASHPPSVSRGCPHPRSRNIGEPYSAKSPLGRLSPSGVLCGFDFSRTSRRRRTAPLPPMIMYLVPQPAVHQTADRFVHQEVMQESHTSSVVSTFSSEMFAYPSQILAILERRHQPRSSILGSG